MVEAWIDAGTGYQWCFVRTSDANRVLATPNYELAFLRDFDDAVKYARQCEHWRTARIRNVHTEDVIMACVL